MAVMMPTNSYIVKCIEVLILHHVDPNSKALVILYNLNNNLYILLDIYI